MNGFTSKFGQEFGVESKLNACLHIYAAYESSEHLD